MKSNNILKKVKLLHYSLVVMMFIFITCNSQNNLAITPAEFSKAIEDSDIQLLDVRSKEEYNNGHIKNALQANWNQQAEFTERVASLDKKKKVYIYCLAGSRSAEAAKLMRQNGYSVVELKGGINAWKQANLAVEGLKKSTGMSLVEFNQILKNNKTVLVDFGAKWCAPCKKMIPVIEKIEKENKDVKIVKLDADLDTEIVNFYKIEVLPTFYVFKNETFVFYLSL